MSCTDVIKELCSGNAGFISVCLFVVSELMALHPNSKGNGLMHLLVCIAATYKHQVDQHVDSMGDRSVPVSPARYSIPKGDGDHNPPDNKDQDDVRPRDQVQ